MSYNLEYFCVSVCGGMLYASSGFIRSPNYPRPYRHGATCVWVITVPTGNTIVVNVNDLDIEASSGCRYDHVLIRDGYNNSAPQIARLCNTNIPGRPIKSAGNTLYISFRSDGSINGRGFELRYTSGELHICKCCFTAAYVCFFVMLLNGVVILLI